MSRYKNCRPSLLGLPDGRFIMAGAEFDLDPEQLKNPSMVKWAAAGWFKPVAAPEAPAPPAYVHPKRVKKAPPATPPADPRAEKLAALAVADAETLLKLAEGEADQEIAEAIHARALQLVK